MDTRIFLALNLPSIAFFLVCAQISYSQNTSLQDALGVLLESTAIGTAFSISVWISLCMITRIILLMIARGGRRIVSLHT